MTKDQAIRIIWEYMHLHHSLKKADAILVLGNRDIKVSVSNCGCIGYKDSTDERRIGVQMEFVVPNI